MSRQNIYDKDVKYDILKPFVDWCTRRSYRRIQVQGRENIPTDGAVLLAPNHCNTLMDALVVLQATRQDKVFGARADMFNNPFVVSPQPSRRPTNIRILLLSRNEIKKELHQI